MDNQINELKQTAEQLIAELNEMQEQAKHIDPSSTEGRALAIAALRKINILLDL